jgi:cysteine-rich repeat protein
MIMQPDARALGLVALGLICACRDEHGAQIGLTQGEVAALDTGATGDAPALRGAIFTTTVDGTRVNANIYAAKADVYLDGGPGSNAPVGAAALPAGDYFFQVTDPSGKNLLSSDHISCRRIHVNDMGVIDRVVRRIDSVSNGVPLLVPCWHAQGIDEDHAELGAITVQLIPYDDTPNPGGEYKVWVTPVARYTGNDAWSPGDVHGFVPSASKTDNFKVRAPSAPLPPACGNGVLEAGEECDDGNLDDFDGCTTQCILCGVCGDGIIGMSEECDDGNRVDGDGCSSNCKLEAP